MVSPPSVNVVPTVVGTDVQLDALKLGNIEGQIDGLGQRNRVAAGKVIAYVGIAPSRLGAV